MKESTVHIKQTRLPSTREIPVISLFLAKYDQLPEKIRIKPLIKEAESNVVFHVKSVLERINIRKELPIIRQYFHPCSKKYFIYEQLISLADIDGIMIHFNNCRWVTNYKNNSKKSIQPDYRPKNHFLIVDEICFFYLNEHESFVKKLAYDLINDDTLSLLEPKIADLRLIGKYKDTCRGPGAFYLTSYIHIKKPYINNLAVSYGGDDFLHVHKKILTWLHKKDANGLVLLHGAPGSGKTHYIRYLLNSIINEQGKYLIYVPGDMINYLTSPRLLPLLFNYRNSLLIIEDAEGSLSRSRTSDQSVANLLNLTDGLLSDGIQIQILATFNCPLTSLDSALLRPGRLIAQYCFPSTLNIENAQILAESIGVSKIDQINQPLSLANIYAMKDEKIEETRNEDDDDDDTTSQCRKCISSAQYSGECGEEE